MYCHGFRDRIPSCSWSKPRLPRINKVKVNKRTLMDLKFLPPRLLLVYSIVLLLVIVMLATNIEVAIKRVNGNNMKIDTNNQKTLLQEQLESVSEQLDNLLYDGTERFHHRCSVVHLAFVVEDVTPLVTQVLKSVLIYRQCPLHFHFVVDSFNHNILQRLFKTWELPYVEYSLYTTDYIRSKLTLRSTFQSNHILNISVLLLPYILPQTIDNVIVLAPNILVVSDIYQLWHLTIQLNIQNKLLGVSMPHSLGGRYDTNVMLMNLRIMRSFNWDQLWQSVVANLPYVTRDVINSFITSYSDSMSVLPCLWSIDHQNQLTCSTNVTDYHLLHLDTTTFGSEKYQEYLKDMETSVQEYDSVNLRHVPFLCGSKSRHFTKKNNPTRKQPLPKKSRREMCKLVSIAQQRTFITHPYYYGIKYKPNDYYDTTLVSQLSLDRLDKLTLLLNHWEGPMSISMYGTNSQAWKLAKLLKQEVKNRDNLVIHLVYKEGWFYPINYLRNLALDSVNTQYVFLNDGDFLPSFGLFEHLKKANAALLTGNKKRALIIPAFNGMKDFIYPSNKKDLLQQLAKQSVSQFCILCSHQTHGPTNYTVWATAEKPYKVEWAYHFEPYVVVDRNVPRYDERFVGYGWNKVSHITTLKAEKYEFVVLPNDFIIHSPHKITDDRKIWNTKNFKFCIDSIWKQFIQDLLVRYGANCLKEEKVQPVMLDIEL